MADDRLDPEELDREMEQVFREYPQSSAITVSDLPQHPPGESEAAVEPAQPLSPPPRHGPERYRLQCEIDRGGMGAVLKGRDTFLDREVAFKFLLGKHRTDAELRRRFAREARITGRLQHPGIVPVYDMGQSPEGHPFFTMSLVEGQTLARLLDERRDPSLELPRFLKIFEKVCEAVGYAHSKGVIHRDLKPGNVMVSPFGVVHVMDWGFAKCLRGEVADTEPAAPDPADSPWTVVASGEVATPDGSGAAPASRNGQAIGTPAYMAPEQARGETLRIDERTDVFELGGILCAILTGRPPYVGRSAEEICERAAAGDLTHTLARLDCCAAEREVVALAKQCLAAEPENRPRDGGAVAAAVTAYLVSDLRRAERDLVRFFDLSPDLFCVAGLDGFFYRVNANFSRVLGYTDAELLARPFLDFVHPEDHGRTLGEMEKLSQGIPVIRFRNRYRDAAGGYRWFEWTAKSIPEERVIFAVARDVTDWIELERNQWPPPPPDRRDPT
jgi:PAS domain S-box-containing protein